MGDLWTPPRGFFPGALSWFHPGNIDRFETMQWGDSECNYILSFVGLQNFLPGCTGGLIGRRIHFWKDEPPTFEFWATITECSGDVYLLDSGPGENIYDGKATISTNVAATIHDLFYGGTYLAPYGSASALRYGWLFSDRTIEWWRRDGFAAHWLGPPP